MTTLRPFRFGVQARGAASAKEWVDLARRIESLGYDTLTMPDHFDDQMAPMPAMMAAASVTDRLRVCALVFDNDYKHPAVLAKELATMDVLSDGRVEIGIGAGWMATDYEHVGIPYDRPGVRIDRFVEGLQIIKSCMGPDPFSFDGEHYQINDFNSLPKPLQGPCPPILIGGGGKRVLTIAAEYADIVGINGTMHSGRIDAEAIATMSAEAVDAKVAIVRQAAGSRFVDIELNVRTFMVNVTNERASTMNGIASMLGVEASMVEHTPFAIVGTTAQIVDDLRARRERWGFSYIIVGAEDVDAIAPVVAELAGT